MWRLLPTGLYRGVLSRWPLVKRSLVHLPSRVILSEDANDWRGRDSWNPSPMTGGLQGQGWALRKGMYYQPRDDDSLRSPETSFTRKVSLHVLLLTSVRFLPWTQDRDGSLLIPAEGIYEPKEQILEPKFVQIWSTVVLLFCIHFFDLFFDS